MNTNNSQRQIYHARINTVMDYIDRNLDQTLTLSELAKVASFSPYHFHRIFSALVGETLNQYIQRIRLEKAAMLLIHRRKSSITEVAFDCGFSGSATFARAFKDYFQMSASDWRNGGYRHNRKNGKTNRNFDQQDSNIRQDLSESSDYIRRVVMVTTFGTQTWRIEMKNNGEIEVQVKELPEMNVAYVRHIGPYKGNEALFEGLFTKLMKWAGPRGLMTESTQCLAVYHDDPDLTDDEKLRLDICLTVPPQTEVEDDIGQMTLPGGKYALARFELASHEFDQAWKAVYGGWLPESGYAPDNRVCFEWYRNDPKEHPEGKHVVDICVPVTPL